MQDKDFDQLFKDQFADAEITPSSNLWAKIEQDLEPKRKRILPAYWMAAAVVIVAVSVGLLMPKTEKIQLQGNPDAMANNMIDNQPASAVKPVVRTTVEVSNDATKSTPLIIAPRLTAEDVKKDFVAMQPILAKSHPVNIAPVSSEDAMAQIEEKVRDNEAMIASVEIPEEANTIVEAGHQEHKGIRNVGDLVNLVINKVDKRDKKLIQFTTDEDDNSSLIAINIGFLKFNKKHK